MLTGVKNRFRPWTVLWITFMWVMLNGEVTWGNVIAGVLLGTFIVLALPLPKLPLPDNTSINWGLLFKFILIWIKDLMVASFKVAWIAIRREDPPKAAIVRAPMRVQNELVLTMATSLYNLQPGGSVTDIDIANRMWTCHLLMAGTPTDLENELQNIANLEKAMINIFERG
ncbi:putative monovalent cation/H+ antiporter subunit E [Corynebacterium renale]|uniref:Multisubunit sodium/proton antiporter MrpE subunit n=1 Tax=Corynebacterium renale TaxID=1724 RepID=A0A2A9DMZ0_9CORY|nr:Na+/H+ antiporter subunit E [Corynebacterium renale]PFG27974.1 multisubunit sodium/proton antiporter MrpE subunit [Corynebacterium renale]SQG63303.1 putative monovalent cation/H+ antiporter subunit E [Corynebacterium renale]SQI21502.1 putative monovalent cation/H+ antiporter subunit E [Corynebacterium renale]STC99443.1 putative monovalent cation/H+ antiporter subunit E [Corynebacterium renale]